MSEPTKTPKRPRGKARLIEGKCIACGARCQNACPSDAIEMNDVGAPIIDVAKCTGCVRCVKICPASALEMHFTPEEQKILAELAARKSADKEGGPDEAEAAAVALKLAAYRGVWVFVEQTEGEAAKVSWELLGAGKELADKLSVEICAVVIGDRVENVCTDAFSYGADKVYLVDQPLFHYYRTAPYLEAVCELVDKHRPEIILMGATGLGRDLAGAVATRVGTGLTAD